MAKTLFGAGAVLCALLGTGCSKSARTETSTATTSVPDKQDKAAAAPAAGFDLNAAIGKPTPAFTLKDADGKTVRPVDYKGKVVLLDFWATWCGPCKVEIPWFIDFQREFANRDFAVVGVSMDQDGWPAVKPYVQNMKMNYRILLGDDDVSSAYGGLDSLPTTLLIGRDGKIASVHVGVSMGKEEFKNAIVQLLDAPRTSASVASGGALALLTSPSAR